VLVTRTKRNDFTASGVTAADHHLECEQTRMGPRVVGDGFERRSSRVDDGAYYQTTFAYWRQLLAARATQVGDGTDDAGAVDADSGRRRDGCHS